MSFWDMLASHTKVAGQPLGIEDGSVDVNSPSAPNVPQSTWSSEEEKSFKAALFITTCARKLEVSSMVKATACWLFHKFYSCVRSEDYDDYIVSMTCIFLAGKIEEMPIKIRDVINVAYRTAYPDKPLLQIDQTYTKLVDTLVEFELFLCRMLKFQLSYDSPHKYLLHYLKSLSDWLSSRYEDAPYSKLAWSLLNDCCLTRLCINTKPDHLAVTVCYVALEACSVKVHLEEHAEKKWWKVFVDDIKLTDITTLSCQVLEMYENEKAIMQKSH